jgi:hypothetical protein
MLAKPHRTHQSSARFVGRSAASTHAEISDHIKTAPNSSSFVLSEVLFEHIVRFFLGNC